MNESKRNAVSSLTLVERLTHEWSWVREDALREPGALDRVMEMLPAAALPPDAARMVDWDDDPWSSGWGGPELKPVEVWEPPAGGRSVDWTHPVYRAQPAALMFDSASPVALAVSMAGPEQLAPPQRRFLEDYTDQLGGGDVRVVTSSDDPRAWFACSLVHTGAPIGPWTPKVAVLGPSLTDDRSVAAVADYLSNGASLPRAVAAVLAALEVLAPGAEHTADDALGPLIAASGGVDFDRGYGGWRRAWISPVDEVRRAAVHSRPRTAFALQFLATDHSPLVREGMAGLSNVRTDLIASLATDELEEVRRQFLDRHRTELTEEILAGYAGDPSAEIRLQLAEVAGLPRGIYERLADDTDTTVAELAHARLGSPTIRGTDQPRCEYLTTPRHGDPLPCLNAATTSVACDDDASIWLCGTHSCPVVHGTAVRCRCCGTNPASYVDLTGDSGPSPSPVCGSCGDRISDYNNGGVTAEGLDEVLAHVVTRGSGSS